MFSLNFTNYRLRDARVAGSTPVTPAVDSHFWHIALHAEGFRKTLASPAAWLSLAAAC
jgi:hypothetical protein